MLDLSIKGLETDSIREIWNGKVSVKKIFTGNNLIGKDQIRKNGVERIRKDGMGKY